MVKRFVFIIAPLLLVLSLSLVADEEEQEANIPDVTFPDSVISAINSSFETVQPMLKYSCFDCHSTYTDKPWYFSIPGLSSWLNGHVEEGREHLDFSNGFPFKGKGSQMELLYDIREEVEEGEMPLTSYRLMHWGRLIEDEKQDTLFQWIEGTLEIIQPYYYPDSDTTFMDEELPEDNED